MCAAKSPTIKRILREAAEIENAPSTDFYAQPLESDLFEWHFTIRGPPTSVYSAGLYHGRIVLPPTYPLRPPAFRFTTPNGRFEANREICLSISGHHEETWQPAWGIRTAIVALRSFMETDAKGQLGGLDTPEATRLRLAQASNSWRCPTCGQTNAQIMQSCEARAKEMGSSSGEAPTPDAIPPELKMGWRDELGANTPTTETPPKRETESKAEAAAMAEGFVQTQPPAPPEAAPIPTPTSTNAEVEPERQIQDPPAPLAIAPAAAPPPILPEDQPSQLHRAFRGQLYGTQDEGVPLWLDRLIVALALLLIALVIKVFIY